MLLTKRRFQSLRRVFRWSSATFRHLRHPNRPPEPAIAPACLFIGRSSSIALAATSTSDHDAPGQRKSQEAQARQAKGQASYPQTEDAAAGRCPRRRRRTQCRALAAAKPRQGHSCRSHRDILPIKVCLRLCEQPCLSDVFSCAGVRDPPAPLLNQPPQRWQLVGSPVCSAMFILEY